MCNTVNREGGHSQDFEFHHVYPSYESQTDSLGSVVCDSGDVQALCFDFLAWFTGKEDTLQGIPILNFWIVGPGDSFGVFPTSHFAPLALSSLDVGPKTSHDQHGAPTDLLSGPKTLRDQHDAPTDLLWSKNVMLLTQDPN